MMLINTSKSMIGVSYKERSRCSSSPLFVRFVLCLRVRACRCLLAGLAGVIRQLDSLMLIRPSIERFAPLESWRRRSFSSTSSRPYSLRETLAEGPGEDQNGIEEEQGRVLKNKYILRNM